ncbi:glucuronate isomerase [Aquipuribacter nitratireducens]|uniref:Uronate isomerase n=1 Tax=Aquipuribacter nitratireducens TaxID=650104 RepID=A0ABW0GSZ5_9MICO
MATTTAQTTAHLVTPTGGPRRLRPHPDRLLPADPATRAVARELYDGIRDLPIVSPHGHVPAAWLAEDAAFRDPTSLLVTPDHYVTRLMHAQGVPLDRLGVGRGPLSEAESREAFRLLCAGWRTYRGTAVRHWLEHTLAHVLDVDVEPSAATADAVYDQVADRIAAPDLRPRALYDRFGLSVLATTDDPTDDLRHHRALAADPSWRGRVVPTFRPDAYVEVRRSDWPDAVTRLGAVADVDTATYAGWIAAMEARRSYFQEHGATSTDHSHRDARAEPLERSVAERLYARAVAGAVTPDEADALRRDLLFQMARMASEDGLVMTLHPAVARDHHPGTRDRYGADVGADIPVGVEFTDALRPVLGAFGTNPRFQLVVFTIDETVYSRELAPLAGFYPSLYVGAPWWFLDAPEAMTRFRSAVTETTGFTRTAGFVDDTRAFLSIPARHDTARRVDAAYLARLVAEHRLDLDEAHEVAHDLTVVNPREAFRL